MKPRTKQEIIEEKITLCTEDIYRMELVRDFNASATESKAAQTEVAKANDRIKDLELQVEWLKTQLDNQVDN